MPPKSRSKAAEDKANLDALKSAYDGEPYAPEVSLSNPDDNSDAEVFFDSDGPNDPAANEEFGGPSDPSNDLFLTGYEFNGEEQPDSDPTPEGVGEIPDSVLTAQAAASGVQFEEVDQIDTGRPVQRGLKYGPAVNAAVQSLLSGGSGIIRVPAEQGKSLSQVVQAINKTHVDGRIAPDGRQINIKAKSKTNYRAVAGTVDLYITASYAGVPPTLGTDGARIG